MSSVYVHINKINNKKYIGFSKHDDPNIRWGNNGSGYMGQRLYSEGISTFGWDNFDHIVLINEIPTSLAKTVENLLIEKLESIENGYNEDKGTICESDYDIALSLLPNLLNKINTNQNKINIKSLNDIVEAKYSSTTVSYRLEYIYNLYKIGRINTNLDCQREYVWDEPRQQGMWDTLLYGHRIPEIHAVKKSNGIYEIIDGKQRLLTLMKILNNEIPLKRGNASSEIKQYMLNTNVASLYFKDIDEQTKNKIYDKEISMAEYSNVDDNTLVVLFQKLNAGKPLSEFQKCIANNIIVRIRYTEYFENSDFIPKLFSSAELSSNEDEILLIRLLSTLNCDDITNVDSLVQRELNKIIERMDIKTLSITRNKIINIIKEFKNLSISPNDLKIINKTWYPILFKFFSEEVEDNLKYLFKDFISYIQIPPQRGQESSKTITINRYNSIKKDWLNYLKLKGD